MNLRNKMLVVVLLALPLLTTAAISTDADAAKKPNKSQAKIDVFIDASGLGAEGAGNGTITAIVGGHSQSKMLSVDVGKAGEANQTQDLSVIYMPFNFNRLTSSAGDQFSVCFNSDVVNVTSQCSDGTLSSAEKGKGKLQKPTKLTGSTDLVL